MPDTELMTNVVRLGNRASRMKGYRRSVRLLTAVPLSLVLLF